MDIFINFFLASIICSSEIKTEFIKNKSELQVPTPKISTQNISNSQIEDFMFKIGKIIGETEKPKEKKFNKSLSYEKIIYNFNLNQITDIYLKTPVKFKTVKGTDVMISVSRASNCIDGSNNCKESDKFLLSFTYNDTTQFANVKDIINLGFFMSGSKDIIIDNETYNAKVNASITDVNSSQIIIKGPGGIVLNKKLKEMIDVFGRFGVKAVLNKEYRIVYGRKVVCHNETCSFSNDKMAFILEYPVSKDSNYYSIDEKKYNGKSIYFQNIGKEFFFTLTNGSLIITRH